MLQFSSLSKLISSVLRISAWAFLVMGLVLGMAWAALHFWIVPRIEDFRPKLESLASQTIGVPVQMGKLVAVSSGWVPTFEIHDLTLLDPDGRRALTLPKIVFAISARSILDLGVEQLVIDSPTLDIRRTADGEWLIAGLAIKNNDKRDSPAIDWIFSQREIVIQHGTVIWTDDLKASQKDSASLNLSDVSWVLRNSARHHLWRLDAAPPAGWGDRFVLMGDLRRNLLSTHPGRFKDWSGQVHAQFPDVELAQLSPHLPWTVNAAKGKGALRIWVDLSNGKVQQTTADLFLENAKAQLGAGLQALSFKNIAGRVSFKPLPNGFDFSTAGLRFDTTDGLHWPGGNVKVSWAEAENGQGAKGIFHGDKLDLYAVRNIALQLPLPDKARQALLEHKVNGLVQSLHVEWADSSNAQGNAFQVKVANGRIDNFSFEGGKAGTDSENLPGIENANIGFDMGPDGGQVKANIEKGAISIHRVFEESRIPLDKMQASVKWVRAQGQLTIPEWQLSLSNADVAGEWHGSWRPSALPNSLGIIDLQGNIARGDATRVHRYLPMALSQNIRYYVRDSVLNGSVQNIAVKIKGDLQNLPFANPKDGEFKLAGKVKDVEYAYVPPAVLGNANRNTRSELVWPAMSNVNGDLVFDRLAFKVNGAFGKWGSTPFTQIMAEIPKLGTNSVVNVQGESKAPVKQLLSDLRQSPVNQMIGGVLSQATGTGAINTRLKLSLPLASLEKTTVQGAVTFSGNDIRILPSVPTFEKTQGSINFTESGFTLANVNAQFLGGPIKLDGGTRKLPAKSTEANPLIRMQGQVTAGGLRQAPEIPLLSLLAPHASGATTYTASLGIKGGESELSVQSQLQGLELNLPSPLNKRAEEMVAVKFENVIQSLSAAPANKAQRDLLQLVWGRAFSASYNRDISGNEPRVLSGRWTVGEAGGASTTGSSESGVVANANLPDFSIDDWLLVFAPPKSSPHYSAAQSTKLGASAQAYLPSRMNFKSNDLLVQGRHLHNVVINGSRDGYVYRTHLDAKELSGYLEYRQSSSQSTARIYARLARLSLPPSAEQAVETLLEDSPVSIPALDIVIEELELRGKKMGRVEIEAINTDSGPARVQSGREWRLNKLNITVPEASFKANGKWVTSREGSQQASTEMVFRLDVSDAGELLNRLGTKDALKGGGGKLEGQVSWQGSPLALHYPSLNGRFNVSIGRGQFLQAEPGVAKLLGVLSLQALPRRLLLDFRDVFSTGFAFDSIRGDVTIQQGIAATQNLQMKGVNAVVQMEGRSDIARETQNLRVLILPEVDAGTASILAGLALNPAIGITTFLAQLILKQPLSRVNSQEFTIDGTWTDPKVTKVGSVAP
jgi:uncharacterized protein (TIGR02099 family)